MDERALVAAARKGSVASFNELVRLHQDLAYSLACRLLGCPEAAAEATQEAFLSAYRALPAFDGGSFRSWLLRLVIECCRRGAARAPAGSDQGLEEGLTTLPWEERVALVLADVAGLGHHQIAAATGARPQQVRGRLHRGRSWLRDWLVTRHSLPELPCTRPQEPLRHLWPGGAEAPGGSRRPGEEWMLARVCLSAQRTPIASSGGGAAQ